MRLGQTAKGGKGGLFEMTMKRVLFVCLGNICRSPAAEGVMTTLVGERGLVDQIEVDSAGTSSYHIGEPADKRMRASAQAREIELTSRSRMVSARDLCEFDWVIAMDTDNYRSLHRLASGNESRIHMMSDFLPEGSRFPKDVPDPYYGGDDGFEEVLDMLQEACPGLLDRMLAD
ncbi:MAG: low molecular weight protein-tyrosine-phosphatase [Planctomycetota bacterium]